MIIFSASYQKQNCHIYCADDDGSSMYSVTGASGLEWCQGPVLSPDRRQLAFYAVSLPQITHTYFIVDIDGTNLRSFTIEPKPSKIYSWLPDDRIFFLSEKKYWTVVLDSSDSHHETFLDGYRIFDLSSDGHRVVATKGTNKQEQIYVADLVDRTTYPLLATSERAGQSQIQYPVAWSPDGQKIACVGGNEDEIWVVNADGSHPHIVAEADYFWLRFNWSPDNRHIAFVRSLDNGGPNTNHGAIYMTGVDGGYQQYIVDVYRPGGKWCWSTDGMFIVYTTFLDGSMQIHAVSVQGQNRKLFDGQELGFSEVYDIIAA